MPVLFRGPVSPSSALLGPSEFVISVQFGRLGREHEQRYLFLLTSELKLRGELAAGVTNHCERAHSPKFGSVGCPGELAGFLG